MSAADFVRALALAWKNLAAYPPGHPALAATLEMAHSRLGQLRGPGGDVVFGIAADGLVYGPEKIDSQQAQKFAQALYTRNVAILRIGAAASAPDVETVLRLLGGSIVPGEDKGPIWSQLAMAGITSIELQPVDYSAVRATEEMVEPPKKPASTLWEEILKALMNDRELSPTAKQLLSSVRTVDELAALIMRHINDAGRASAAEFDPDATFGIKLTARIPETPEIVSARVAKSIGTFVATATGIKRQLAVQQILQLLRGLPDPMRQTVIRAVMHILATDASAESLLRDFTLNLERDEILEALRALPEKNLSQHALKMLEALATADKPILNENASRLVTTELKVLFGDEDIDRFNPPDHQKLLETVSINVPTMKRGGNIARLGDRVETVSDDAVQRTLARTLLDLILKLGDRETPEGVLVRLETSFRAAVSAGHLHDALEIVRDLKQSRTVGAHQAIARMASVDNVRALIETLVKAPPEKAGGISLLLDALGSAAMETMLLALAEESNRSRRRRLVDFIASLGPRIVPDVVRFLHDDRWYVVRNMIFLLRTVNDRTSLPEIHRLATHPDMRVRLEAIKSLIALESAVPRSLLEDAINDPDPKLAETAVTLVGNYGIREAVGPLLRILEKRDLFGSRRSLRVRVIKALGELADESALPQLDRYFRDPFLPWWRREERRAAFESLASYPAAARAPLVERGLDSRDDAIRAVCAKLAEES